MPFRRRKAVARSLGPTCPPSPDRSALANRDRHTNIAPTHQPDRGRLGETFRRKEAPALAPRFALQGQHGEGLRSGRSRGLDRRDAAYDLDQGVGLQPGDLAVYKLEDALIGD